MDTDGGAKSSPETKSAEVDTTQDSDSLKQELDDMLGSLTLELEELVQEVHSDAAATPIDAPKARLAPKKFLRPTSSGNLASPVKHDEDSSGSDDEMSLDAAEELHSMLQSVELPSEPAQSPEQEAEEGPVSQEQIDHLLHLNDSLADDGVVTCTVEEFLGEDHGFQESDEEEEGAAELGGEEDQQGGAANDISGGGYWSSVGSYAAAGWGLAASSIAKATELSKSSLAATKQTIAGKVSSLKADPAVIAKCEQKYIDILHQKGAIEIIVTSGQAARVPFNIPRGFSLSWALRVREYDIGFGVRERKQARGGAIDEHLEEMRKIRCVEGTTEGGLEACDRSRQVVLVFDNSYSKLRPKACVYLVNCAKDAYVVPVLETVTGTVAASDYTDNGVPGAADEDVESHAPPIDDYVVGGGVEGTTRGNIECVVPEDARDAADAILAASPSLHPPHSMGHNDDGAAGSSAEPDVASIVLT